MNSKCPFCGVESEEIAEMPKALRGMLEAGQRPVTLCTECLEPVILDWSGMRKPTPNEYQELHEAGELQKLGNTREIMRKFKAQQHNDLPCMCMWEMFKERTLQYMIPWPMREAAETAMRNVFMSGVKAGTIAVRGAFDASNTAEEFERCLKTLNAELEFYRQLMQSDIDKRQFGNRHQRRSSKNGE